MFLKIFVFLQLACLLSACGNLIDLEDTNIYKTFGSWSYYKEVSTNDSTKLLQLNSMIEIFKSDETNILVMETKLPNWEGKSPALYIGQIDYFLQVYLNKKLIYKLSEPSNKKLIGLNQNLVELPYFIEGDLLTMRVGTTRESANVLNDISLSSSENIISNVFINSAGSLIFSALFFFIGISVFLIYIGTQKSKLLFGIAAFITSNSVLFASNSLILQLLVEAPLLYYSLDYISLVLLTTSGFFTIEQIINIKFKNILKVIWQSHFAILISSILLLNFTKITFPDILPYFMVFLALSMLVSFFAMILSTKSGNFESKLLFFGMSSFFFFAVIEIILYFQKGLFSDFGFSVRVLHIGALCFITTLIWIVISDYLNTNRQREIANKKELEASKRENETRQQYAAKLLESQEHERKRIAAELHDAVGQDLLIIKNTALLGLSNNDIENSSERYLNQISDVTSKSIEDIRKISRNLHPFQIEKLGLTKALKSIVNFVQENSQLTFISKIDELRNVFSKEEAIHIYRILQETINNILKHSSATEINIQAEIVDNRFYLVVSDNGKGMPLDKEGKIYKADFGFGLTGILERAKILGGKMEIKSNNPKGLLVNITIPFDIELEEKINREL